MKSTFLTLSFSLLSCVFANAQDFVLKGTIGTYPVVMQLDRNNKSDAAAELTGSYYYESQGPGKRLGIKLTYVGDGKWKMTEYDGNKENATFTINVPTFRVGDVWKGKYTINGKTLNYTLGVKKSSKEQLWVYEGKIGNYPVVMELLEPDDYNEHAIGSYYYVSQGPSKRIVIEGYDVNMGRTYWSEFIDGKSNGEFVIRFQDPEGEEICNDDFLCGSYIDAHNKSYYFELRRVNK